MILIVTSEVLHPLVLHKFGITRWRTKILLVLLANITSNSRGLSVLISPLIKKPILSYLSISGDIVFKAIL